jgi:hypothetical protein
MEAIAVLVVIALVGYVAKFALRIYLTVKHPHIRDAWDEAEERREAKRKKVAGGALNAGLGIAKVFLKK